jgi:hypothetical protein
VTIRHCPLLIINHQSILNSQRSVVPQFEFSDGIAPPGQEGWTRHQEKYREASFDGADGVVVQDQTEMFRT